MAGQTLSLAQVIALWIKAGGSIAQAPVAAARAMAESGGRTAVTSPNPDGGTNVGVFQLDTKGVGAGHTVAQLSDPLTNAQITVKATKDGADWGQWADNYGLYLPAAQTAAHSFSSQAASHPGGLAGLADDVLSGVASIGKTVSGAVSSAVGSVLQLPSQVTDFFSALEAPLQALMWLINPVNWVRMLAGAAGVILAGLGLYALAKAA
jgi:hypothetical protein